MRVLITGAAGFIGTHLARELDRAGHTAYTTDRKPRDLFGGRINVQDDLLYGRATGQLRSSATCAPVDAILASFPPLDAVVHLAAQVGRQFGEDAPAVAAADNVGMTALVARSCANHGVRLVYASTSEVYGDTGECTAVESPDRGRDIDGPPLAALYGDLPHNIYGLTKRQAEEAAALYCTWHGVTSPKHVDAPAAGLQVIRPSMPYGPGLPAGRGRAAIVNFLWLAHHGAPLTVHRGAERSWCWIGDCVAGIRAVLESGDVAYTHAAWRAGVGCYNVGRDDAAVSMLAVADLAIQIAGLAAHGDAERIRVELVDPPARQTIVKRLATDKLRGLGWAPTVDLEDGMRRTYDWLVANDWQGVGAP
jgi:nucleoside-diphosphate-sugar epimerase